MATASKDDEKIKIKKYHQNTQEVISRLVDLYLKYNLTLVCLEDIANLVNNIPGNITKVPVTKYSLMRSVTAFGELVHYINCEKCGKYSANNRASTDKLICEHCSNALQLKETNFFVYINIEAQLKVVIEKYWKELSNYKDFITENNNPDIEDVHSGLLLKAIHRTDPDCMFLSITLNTDGVSIHESNTLSLWPLQFCLNFLPPKYRFQQSNILVSSLYYGNRKPNLLEFFAPFAEEMEKLQNVGFEMNIGDRNVKFKVFITQCNADLPAKCMV